MDQHVRDIGCFEVKLTPLRELQARHVDTWQRLLLLLKSRSANGSAGSQDCCMEPMVEDLVRVLKNEAEGLKYWALVLGDWMEVLHGELADLHELSLQHATDGLVWKVKNTLELPLTLLISYVRGFQRVSHPVALLECAVEKGQEASPSRHATDEHDRCARAIQAALGVDAKPQQVKWVGILFAWQQAVENRRFVSYTDFVRCMITEFADVGGRDCKETYKEYFNDTYLMGHKVEEWEKGKWEASMKNMRGRAKTKLAHFGTIRKAALAFIAQYGETA